MPATGCSTTSRPNCCVCCANSSSIPEVSSMLCPWCLHYGAEDQEYLFDSELYCGLCAQQPPDSDGDWERALLAMDQVALSYIEEELNHIAVSKSGLQPEL